jgi:transposase
VGKADYRAVDDQRFPGMVAYETEKVVLGQRRRVVLTHSDDLHAKQCAGFDQTLAKARRRLAGLQARLARGQTKRAKDKVEAEVAEILKPRWLARVLSVSLSGQEPAELRLSYRTNAKARAALEEEIFGKRVLFSDKGPALASTAQVVADYRSQEAAEGDFRQMKDPKVVSFSPMFHWSDQKIRVHVFYCVLALMAARLMTRQAERAGLAMSVRELLGALAEVQETVLLYQGERGRPRARRVTTEMSASQQRLFELFGLGAYAPARP